jgi:hypothetical protein
MAAGATPSGGYRKYFYRNIYAIDSAYINAAAHWVPSVRSAIKWSRGWQLTRPPRIPAGRLELQQIRGAYPWGVPTSDCG